MRNTSIAIHFASPHPCSMWTTYFRAGTRVQFVISLEVDTVIIIKSLIFLYKGFSITHQVRLKTRNLQERATYTSKRQAAESEGQTRHIIRKCQLPPLFGFNLLTWSALGQASLTLEFILVSVALSD